MDNYIQTSGKYNQLGYNMNEGGAKMAQVTFSVRMDETLKRQLDQLCLDFGMNTSTAINIFAKAVVREGKIPFEIYSNRDGISREGALRAIDDLRRGAIENGKAGMSIEEINEEISLARKGL
jgi:addiction module RelB/DinJ family antitoxin